MKAALQDLRSEFQLIFRSKTFDAILLPLIFVVSSRQTTLSNAFFLTLAISTLFLLFRLLKKQKWIYSFAGTLGVILSGGFALLASNATNYFLPGILSNGFLLIISAVSLFIRRPMAIYLSHLSRGWELPWYFRTDIFPAYAEVTWMWTLLFVLRTFIQIYLYIQQEVTQLFIVNTLMGTPAIIVVLSLSYLYGIYRLKQLKGPGIDEYREQKQPPYVGQRKGF